LLSKKSAAGYFGPNPEKANPIQLGSWFLRHGGAHFSGAGTQCFQMLNGPVLMDPVDGGGIFGAVRLRVGMISRGAANRTHEFPELRANDGLSLRVAKRMTHVNGFPFTVTFAKGAAISLIRFGVGVTK